MSRPDTTHHYHGAQVAAAELDKLIAAAREFPELTSEARAHLDLHDDGEFKEYARHYAPDHVDELELMPDPACIDEAERMLGLLEDVSDRVHAAAARGETERDGPGER